jgi:hypothetical protein
VIFVGLDRCGRRVGGWKSFEKGPKNSEPGPRRNLTSMDFHTLLTVLFGTGFVGLLVKELFAWKKNRADAEGVEIENEDKRLGQIQINTQVINDLLKDSETNVKKMRELNSQIDALQGEKDDLAQSLLGAKKVIEYQKEERHEWTLLLEKILKREAESNLKIAELEKRVADLEAINETLTKGDLRLQAEHK